MANDNSRTLIAEAVDNLLNDLVTARKPVRDEVQACMLAAFEQSEIPLDGIVQFEEILRDLLKELQRAWA